jgi:EAL domain-containing protein (putative c-di-GMP-specific phosphodiesterase class I)
MQIDYMKIDASVVANLSRSSVDYEILLAISRIAKALGIQTIAQGVEDVKTRDALAGLGIDLVQGVLTGRPRPLHTGGSQLGLVRSGKPAPLAVGAEIAKSNHHQH